MSDELLGLRNGVQTALAIHRAASRQPGVAGVPLPRGRLRHSATAAQTATPAIVRRCHERSLPAFRDRRARRAPRRSSQKSGAHVVVAEPRWPGFFELAKREKPYAIAIDFSHAPSHALETADYISKARETKDAALFLLRVPDDRLEAVQKRLPQAALVDGERALRQARRRWSAKPRRERAQKKEAAAAAKKAARAAGAGGQSRGRRARPRSRSRAARKGQAGREGQGARPAAKKKPAKKAARVRRRRPQPKKKK